MPFWRGRAAGRSHADAAARSRDRTHGRRILEHMEHLNMLVIKVELWPGGDERYKTVLARAGIGNMSNSADVSDYEILASEGATPLTGTPAWKGRGLLHQHDRRRSVWALVAKAAAWPAAKAEKQEKQS